MVHSVTSSICSTTFYSRNGSEPTFVSAKNQVSKSNMRFRSEKLKTHFVDSPVGSLQSSYGAFCPNLGHGIHRDRNISIVAVVKRSPKRLKYAAFKSPKGLETTYLKLDPYEIDTSSLQAIADKIKAGGIGIIPTDTVYAIVCDLKNKEAVERLYRVKNMDPKKPLSILCRSFRDIDTYTLGFPRGNGQGQTNVFRAARQCLPGPYTFILKASKEMPKQCTSFGGSLAAQCAPRKSVGVRMPEDAICQALLNLLDDPLLCTSVTQQSDDEWLLDPAIISETFDSTEKKVDFIIDGGVRVASPSTVIDMTGTEPLVLRHGKGHLDNWMLMLPNDPVKLPVQGNPYATK